VIDVCDHAVSFYADDAELAATVAAYFFEGLAADEPITVVATPGHRSAIEHELLQLGIPLRLLRDPGRYRAFDAAEVLRELMSDGELVPEQFHARLTTLLGPGHTRVFGEMVALLWAAGDVASALRLEELWNEARELAPFSLLCAYPRSVLHDSDSEVAEVTGVCAAHNLVAGPAWYADPPTPAAAGGPRRSDIFLPVPEAVGAARAFVVASLPLADPDLLEDATLVASEMVTNAVLHGDSAFRVLVSTDEALGVRISVEDAVAGVVVPRFAAPDALDGRGMVIVEALSTSWGCEPRPAGKVVWAELAGVGELTA
jgi:hypothetical protein